MNTADRNPRKGVPRKPEAPGAVTARGKKRRANEARQKRKRWEVSVTDEEREELKAHLRRLRT